MSALAFSAGVLVSPAADTGSLSTGVVAHSIPGFCGPSFQPCRLVGVSRLIGPSGSAGGSIASVAGYASRMRSCSASNPWGFVSAACGSSGSISSNSRGAGFAFCGTGGGM